MIFLMSESKRYLPYFERELGKKLTIFVEKTPYGNLEIAKNDEVIFTGEIPARCIGEYRNDLNFYTNGRSVCLTELKGYQEISGEPVLQPRRPNSRLDKVRHMFQKIT